MGSYSVAVFAFSMAAIATIFLLSTYSFISKRFEFWPPPEEGSWQHRGFRALFRMYFYGLVLLSALEMTWDPIRSFAGVSLLLIGFGLALHWTNFLGWRNAFGEAESLKTQGIYRYSRNPVYVASLVGMIGWGIAVPSIGVQILLVSWAILYLLAPFFEEPWLLHKFGSDFEAYCEKTSRYIGFSR